MASSLCGRLIIVVWLLCVFTSGVMSARPTFRDEPQNTNVHRGDTAVLRCSVDRYTSSTSIGWWVDGLEHSISRNRGLKQANLSPEQLERYSITGDPSRGEFNLQIVNFTDSDAGTYKCRIFASTSRELYSSFSRDAALTIAPYPPWCYVDSNTAVPMVGDTVDLVCESRNTEYRGNLRWMYAGRSFLTGNTTRLPVVRSVVRRVLITKDYNARFMCFEESRTCVLIPLRRFIPVLIQTADIHPQTGDTLNYKCVAPKDLTPLSYSWFINGEDMGITGEELTLGPVNVSYNGSVLECVVKHHTGFKGNHSVAIFIHPSEGGTRTITAKSTAFSFAPSMGNTKPVPSTQKTSTPQPAAVYKGGGANTGQEAASGDLLLPFVIAASVVGVLLTAVIVLLIVCLSRERSSNRRGSDAVKSQEFSGDPPSDCVPLDSVVYRDVNVNGSPCISVGTVKGFKNHAGCGSIDTFEMDLDPDKRPHYFTLEHAYYEATVGNVKWNGLSDDNQDSGFDGIEVSETITPDSELTARNRKFSFGSSPPPPPAAFSQSHQVAPSDFEESSIEDETLVPAYAVTDVSRSNQPDAQHSKRRGESLKRPLPARPREGDCRATSATFSYDQSPRGFGSVKSLDEQAVGALARTLSLKRPLPATPRDSTTHSDPHTPDAYRNPKSFFTRIPPFLTSERSPSTYQEPVTPQPQPPERCSPKFRGNNLPKKYQKLTIPTERLSAVTSASEGDYAEIDPDRDASSIASGSCVRENISIASGELEDETRSTVDLDDLAESTATSKDTLPLGKNENEYDMVPSSDEEDKIQLSSSLLTNPSMNHDSEQKDDNISSNKTGPENKMLSGNSLKYSKVQKPKETDLNHHVDNFVERTSRGKIQELMT